ncbi:MAG: hypothetical protein ABUL49_00895, partial [bacterium]
MIGRSKLLLLPILGALAAVIAFAIAQPFVGTLDHRSIPLDDPASHFSTGTLWDIVEHIAFGALLCGSFCYVLARERGRPWLKTLLGTLAGALVVPSANSFSDILGIGIERGAPLLRGIFSGVIWCVFVPTAIAFTLALVLGMTPQRLLRAVMASVFGFFAS